MILDFFCPPAAMALGASLFAAETYSVASGKDWGTGRKLDRNERILRGVFMVFDLVPGIGYLSKVGKSGSNVAAKALIKQTLKEGFEQGTRNLDTAVKFLSHFGDNVLQQMDNLFKQGDQFFSKARAFADGTLNPNFGKHNARVIMPGTSIDDSLDAGKKFTLNGGKAAQNVADEVIDWNLIKSYIDDIERQTGKKISNEQLGKLKEAIRSKKYVKLTPVETAKHRSAFNKVKDDLIAQWEKQTGQKWPTYTEDVFGKDGQIIRRAGQKYDAHHIIENSYGGEHKWWNIHPAKFPNEHQAGIHRAGSPAHNLFK